MDSNTMALEFNDVLKNSKLNIVCVCDHKYLKYFMTLLKSANLNSPNVSFHICLVNQGRHKNKIKNKARKIFKDVEFYFEEITFSKSQNPKAFFANFRAQFLLRMLESGLKNIVYIDVDSLLRYDITKYDWKFNKYDISVFFRDSSDPRFKLLSGVIALSGNEKSKLFVESWANEIFPTMFEWFADQITFYKVYDKFRNKIRFGNLDQAVIDWHFNNESFIWAGKGNRKKRNLRYIFETLKIRIKYLINPS